MEVMARYRLEWTEPLPVWQREGMKAAVVSFLLLLSAVGVGAEEPLSTEAYTAEYNKWCDVVEAKYPEVKNEKSVFCLLLDARVDLVRAKKDPMIAKPRHILDLADQVAADLRAANYPVQKGDEKFAPVPTAPPASAVPKPDHPQKQSVEVPPSGGWARQQTRERSGQPTTAEGMRAQHDDYARRVAEQDRWRQEQDIIQLQRDAQRLQEQQRQIQEAQQREQSRLSLPR